MKNVVRQMALLVGVLLLACVVCRLATRNVYVDRIPVAQGAGAAVRIVPDSGRQGEIVKPGEPTASRDGIQVTLRAGEPGEAWYAVRDPHGVTLSTQHYQVGRFLTVYDYDTGGFTGDSVVMAALTAFWLGTALIMLKAFRQATGPAFYAYDTIYYVGFGVFALVSGVMLLNLFLRRLARPQDFLMLDVYAALCDAGFNFMVVTLPLLVVFAVAMCVSNLALLRHERAKLKNVLGLLVGLGLLAGEALGIALSTRSYFSTPQGYRLQMVIQNVYTTAFAYFACMLMGAAICGLLAARHVPLQDRDFIIILGCWFRSDGTLTPLLQGRVDRALQFWREQQAATGKVAMLVPSGGQGSNEPCPEAEAMRRYLLGKGVPEEWIMAEDRSANTYQNMAFSRALIEKARPGGKVAFATTNYHVFRSGVWARLAGLQAEGLGSRTRWWYWPNAFMRECAGLMAKRWRQELLLVAALAVFFSLLTAVI